jgi:hypothetical protein
MKRDIQFRALSLLPRSSLPALRATRPHTQEKGNAGAKALCLPEMAELIDLLRNIQVSTRLQQNWKVDHARGC